MSNNSNDLFPINVCVNGSSSKERKVKCPNNVLHNRFITTAHEVHDWIVDSHGNFIEDLGVSEVSANPDVDNIWRCEICGAEAIAL